MDYESGYARRLDSSVRSAILGGQAEMSRRQAILTAGQWFVGEQIGADGWEITYQCE